MEIFSARQKDCRTRRIATVGMFDGVHLGHRHLLRSLIEEGDRRGLAPMAVTFSSHPMHTIAPSRPVPPAVSTLAERISLLDSTGLAGCLILDFDRQLMKMSAREFLCMLRDNFGVCAFLTGFNNRFGCDTSLTFDDYRDIAHEEDIELLCATQFDNRCHDNIISSSAIRELIGTRGDVTEAAMMLGRPFSLSGKVIHGRAIGRTIGFPTANILPDSPDKLIPRNGVYACQAILQDQESVTFPAMVNIGDRPTFDDSRERSIEAHIIGLDRDIYGMTLTLRFIQRVRDEQRFSSPEALSAQLEADRESTIEINSQIINNSPL